MGSHRADFTRNERSILDAAARVLADAPAAGMGEIAADAGLGRATLYRHFPTREGLIEGLRREAFDAIAEVIAATAATPPEGRVERLCEQLIEVGARWRLVFGKPLDERHAEEVRRRFDRPICELLRQAQARGELTAELTPAAMLIVLGGAITAILTEIAAGRMTVVAGQRLLVRSFLGGCAQPAPAPA
ncbi:helix-turn-helix domain-containing protein [Conexibacter sp. JD483]|uniref:TetR/AcrR family transcriptional regulator n=1 Tax=unclassified Conexibacter TaxID=2627773 RepID=UPI00271C1503|nr:MULTISPECIES: TetR/AcrR family transcriptional regulator [unclassified Conexibacter]MDO8187434.1 helix-turn-helix domain-containing protein [Conexibacter sp. CPCC 205706]MDO8198668.1 helix-turn-helix domain-containing protein [Conexibacter sp. CPCC 205762]MDR9369846.1 helix-turn-helix domain-containing protein [Conexibacter sp. JD483]